MSPVSTHQPPRPRWRVVPVTTATLDDLVDVTRRDLLRGIGALGVGWAVSGCGRGAADGGTEPSAGARSIDHKYGATELSGVPERVVTVGLTEQDYVLALGVTPVGVREWFGGHPGALWPWARDKVGDDPLPEVLPVVELDFERIAALDADLILGVNSGLSEAEYETLSGIAPTVAQPGEYADFGAPWQEITRIVGRALGQVEQAERLIPDVEARFAQARGRHPELRGATALLAAALDDGSVYVYAEGPAPGFLTELGFELPPAAAELFAGDENRAPVQLSPEQLSVLEGDVLVMGVYGTEALRVADRPVYQALGLAREGRDILMPETSEVNGALTFGSVLSLPLALEQMVPRLAAAVDGDPATEPEPIS